MPFLGPHCRSWLFPIFYSVRSLFLIVFLNLSSLALCLCSMCSLPFSLLFSHSLSLSLFSHPLIPPLRQWCAPLPPLSPSLSFSYSYSGTGLFIGSFAVEVGVDVTMHVPLVSHVLSTGVGLSYTFPFCAAFQTIPTDGSCLVDVVVVVDCRETSSSVGYSSWPL